MADKWDMVEIGNSLPITVDVTTLTYMELKLLLQLLEPDMVLKTVAERCEIAGCSRWTWYKAMKKPLFVEALNQLTMASIKDHVPALIKAGVKHALAGSYQHWNKLLEMGGVIQPTSLEGGEITIRFADPRAKAIEIAAGPDQD